MRERHGSPFEHGSITFLVTAPVFVWWNHVRHRIGTSYNLESSRYREMEPRFYLPSVARSQSGKPGAYTYQEAPNLTGYVERAHIRVAHVAWNAYRSLLNMGVAREQAMQVLPMNLMYSGYVTFNPRSLMNFIALRMSEHARSEINTVASDYYKFMAQYWPDTAEAFATNGFTAP
jgi:thymidylate synthase (FAD)